MWRADAVFDSKQATGDLAAFTFWNAVAGRAISSAVVVWVLGLLVAAYTELRGPHHAEGRRQIRFALGVPLAVFIAGIAVSVLLMVVTPLPDDTPNGRCCPSSGSTVLSRTAPNGLRPEDDEIASAVRNSHPPGSSSR